LDDLRRRLRRYRKIHVIRDNPGSHTSLEVIQYQWKHECRIEVHLLPAYSPDLNPIVRVWWHLHENITRNHRCKDLDELLDRVFSWLEQANPFRIEGSVYPEAMAARSTFPSESFYLVLQSTGGKKVQAARILGITRVTLRMQLRELGMSDTKSVEGDEDEPV
jgi:transposase